MRLDMFLRNSGLITRRPLAKRAVDGGLVSIDDHPAKPSSEVKVGQQITLRLGTRIATHRVLDIPERPVPKDRRNEYTELISSEPNPEVDGV